MGILLNKKNVLNGYRPKVFVGMSGGVDSSVSAVILKEAGYDVIGVFIKVWSPEWLPCTWREERREAMRVAAHLKISLITLDLEKEYKKEVADYMIREYREGKVPNPDVMCNKVIKFGGFFDFAMKNGADFVATGHYARVTGNREAGSAFETPLRIPSVNSRLSSPRSSRQRRDTCPLGCGRVFQALPASLLAATDQEKDQTYFLWTLGQKQLSRTLFPVGGMRKNEVRRLAKKFGLPNAEKKDSQGLCFLGHVDMTEFLKHYIKPKQGEVLDEKGNVIGTHDGVAYYTIGERHGFFITDKTPNDLPWYIFSKDIKNNTITVSHKKILENKDSKEILIKNVKWCSGREPDPEKKYSARIRYRQPLQFCHLEKINEKKFKVVFDKSQESIASGQSIVIYDDEVCLGGGIIK